MEFRHDLHIYMRSVLREEEWSVRYNVSVVRVHLREEKSLERIDSHGTYHSALRVLRLDRHSIVRPHVDRFTVVLDRRELCELVRVALGAAGEDSALVCLLRSLLTPCSVHSYNQTLNGEDITETLPAQGE